jgi:hypothetical protein
MILRRTSRYSPWPLGLARRLRRARVRRARRPGTHLGVKDNPLELKFHYETSVGKNQVDR